jgi:hypothetical protein
MERQICTIAVLAAITILFISLPGDARRSLVKNSEVIAYVTVDNFRCVQNTCHSGNTTVTTTGGMADIFPSYVIKGKLPKPVSIRLPVT